MIDQQDIRRAHERIRIDGGAVITPLEYSAGLSARAGCSVYLKGEHLQRTGSFKFRGALNSIAALNDNLPVLAASTGNHGMGVAMAARLHRRPAVIYVPENASKLKLASIEGFGAKLVKVSGDCLLAETQARAAAEAGEGHFISPYNDPLVMAGQGTIGLELSLQIPELDAVFVSVGGGGLIGGIGTWLKAHMPRTEVVGCWAGHSPVMYRCMNAGRIVDVAEKETLSDATAGGLEQDSITLEVCKQVIDHRILVAEEDIAAAMKLLATHERYMVEGAAALALAALLKNRGRYRDKRVAVVLCGRNIALETFLAAVA